MSEGINSTKVTFWGTRGSVATPGENTKIFGGNTLCVSVEHEKTLIVLDAGTGIRNIGLKLRGETDPVNVHLLLSHTHWDHIQGLPFFETIYSDNADITIYGSHRKERFLESVLSGQMHEDYFPVSMKDLPSTIRIHEIKENRFRIDNIEVESNEQFPHPGGSVVYTLMVDGKKIIYATDLELDPLFAEDASEEQKKLAAEFMEVIENGDLLICDAQFTDGEYAKAVGWGHSTMTTAAEVAYKAGVKTLAMFHHNPEHSDDMLYAMEKIFQRRYSQRERTINILMAREGGQIVL